jgi:hypothetical protein
MSPRHGDLRHEWSPDKPEEVELARKAFDDARRKGMTVYKMDDKGDQIGPALTAFDPKIRRMIAIAPLGGG